MRIDIVRKVPIMLSSNFQSFDGQYMKETLYRQMGYRFFSDKQAILLTMKNVNACNYSLSQYPLRPTFKKKEKKTFSKELRSKFWISKVYNR